MLCRCFFTGLSFVFWFVSEMFCRWEPQIRSFIKRQTSSTSSDNEWYNEWQRVVQRVTTNGNKWYNEWQRVTTSGTTNDNEWQRVTISFFQIREEATTKHPKENSLNIEEDLWRGPIELRAERSPKEEILTVRRRNVRSSCSQIFIKISVLKIFVIFTGNHLCRSLFLRKLQILKPTSLLKGDSTAGVFLWILGNF